MSDEEQSGPNQTLLGIGAVAGLLLAGGLIYWSVNQGPRKVEYKSSGFAEKAAEMNGAKMAPGLSMGGKDKKLPPPPPKK